MNDWYIDRSKNFLNDSFKEMLVFFNENCNNGANSTEVVALLKQKGLLTGAEGNINAALTRFRDHGLLNKDNSIGDSARDYLDGKIGSSELIIDMFCKRPAKKTGSPNVKPFLVLCMVFDNMLQTIVDADDIFITYEECKEYLFPIDSYSEVSYDLVDKIVSNRVYEYQSKMPKPRVSLQANEDTNLSIWFNALKETPLFMPVEGYKNVLRPNIKQSEFFRFLAVNAEEISQTPTANNAELYNYYCNGQTGISEILPIVIKTSATIDEDKDVQIIFEYLFGYKKIANFDYGKYFKYECFGLFFPFITIPKIVVRNIWRFNQSVGDALYKFISAGHGYLETFEEEEFEYKSTLYHSKKAITDIMEKNVIGIHITKKHTGLSENDPHICIGWSLLGDLSEISTKDELADLYSLKYPDRSVNAKAQDISQIWTFLDKLRINDYVVYFDGKAANIGIVVSNYYFSTNIENQDADYTNNKKVKWLKRILYGELPKSVRSAGKSARSIFSLNDYKSVILDILNDEIYEEPIDIEEEEANMVARVPRVYKVHPMNLILYGAPGTGKTYATAEYALAIVEHREVSYAQKNREQRSQLMEQYNELLKEGRIVFTTFHQSYGYEDFIQGLRPDTESEKMSFKTVDGVFKRIADRAMADKENDYVIIIDEINRANISKVFGELITLIEEDKRWGELNAISITLPSGESFAVPNNLYIVGTMNSADKSISLIDTALRRRFEFVEVTPDYTVVEDEGLRAILEKLNKGLADELDSTDLLIGHAYFIGKTMNNLCEIMNRSIIPLLYEYFYDNAKKVKDLVKKAVDGYNYDIQDGKIGRIKLVKKD